MPQSTGGLVDFRLFQKEVCLLNGISYSTNTNQSDLIYRLYDDAHEMNIGCSLIKERMKPDVLCC